VIWFGGIVLTVLGFILGRVFSQSETILSEKRRIYEEFLRNSPSAQDAYGAAESGLMGEKLEKLRDLQGPLSLYASPNVMLALSLYLQRLDAAASELRADSPALHPLFKAAAKAHNDLILEMRRDALALSAFAYVGKSRLPADALEKAKQNMLD
jgi:hypothetical protein